MNYITTHADCLVMFKPTTPQLNLVIKYSPFSITEEPPFTNSRTLQTSFTALLGIKKIRDIPFLVVATDSFPCCTLPGEIIYEIRKIDWIPVVPNEKVVEILEECQDDFQDISKLFNDGHHYYCEKYMLNKPYSINATYEQSNQESKFYRQFIWNQGIMTCNGEFQILKNWCKPIIQGYIQGFETRLQNGEKLTYNIISRRSNKKAGTRYYSRGIDDKGNVANFTQTQQIFFVKQYAVSHLQIRGSVPAFFEQLGISGLNGQLQINRNEATTKKAFQLHFQKLSKIFEKILCLNLLSIKKSDEQKLTLFFQSMVDHHAPQFVKYQYFDFHQQCKNNQFQNSKILVDKVKALIDYFGCNIIDRNTNKFVQKQKGVIRTNCMDCLDRTNYIQSRISLYLFEAVLYRLNSPDLKKAMIRQQIFVNRHENSSELLKKYNEVWAQNGDSISLHYTGIGSTHTDITKTGKRTFKGTVNHKMRSLMRFFTQFTDTKKHEAINNLMSTEKDFRSSLALEGPQVDILDVVVMTYEIAPENIVRNQNSFTQNYIERKRPAMVVIGGYLKSSSNWFKGLFKKQSDEQVNAFIDKITFSVRRLGYQIFGKVKNDQSCLLIFGNQFIIRNVSQIRHQDIDRHKDSILVTKFYVYQSSMAFCYTNSDSFSATKSLIEKSHEQAFQKNKLGQARSSSILQNHHRTIIGNIGSENSISSTKLDEMEEKRMIMQSKRDIKNQMTLIRQVLEGDQFTKSVNSSKSYLKNYMEGPTNFIPRQNRIIFWNQDNLIVKVYQYNENKRKKCVYAHLGYQLGLSKPMNK